MSPRHIKPSPEQLGMLVTPAQGVEAPNPAATYPSITEFPELEALVDRYEAESSTQEQLGAVAVSAHLEMPKSSLPDTDAEFASILSTKPVNLNVPKLETSLKVDLDDRDKAMIGVIDALSKAAPNEKHHSALIKHEDPRVKNPRVQAQNSADFYRLSRKPLSEADVRKKASEYESSMTEANAAFDVMWGTPQMMEDLESTREKDTKKEDKRIKEEKDRIELDRDIDKERMGVIRSVGTSVIETADGPEEIEKYAVVGEGFYTKLTAGGRLNPARANDPKSEFSTVTPSDASKKRSAFKKQIRERMKARSKMQKEIAKSNKKKPETQDSLLPAQPARIKSWGRSIVAKTVEGGNAIKSANERLTESPVMSSRGVQHAFGQVRRPDTGLPINARVSIQKDASPTAWKPRTTGTSFTRSRNS